jgi:hypothetical protein
MKSYVHQQLLLPANHRWVLQQAAAVVVARGRDGVEGEVVVSGVHQHSRWCILRD